MAKRIRTFDDVHLRFAGKGAPEKREVAKAMGITPETFSRNIADRDKKPSADWLSRFERGWLAAVGSGAGSPSSASELTAAVTSGEK